MRQRLMRAVLPLLIFLTAGLYSSAQQSAGRPPVSGSIVDAVALYDNGRYEQALNLLTRLCSSEPENDAAWYWSGMCKGYLGDIEAAISDIREAVRLDPSNYWYRDRLARLYAATERPELAIDIYESLLKDFPKKSDISYTLIQLYTQQGKMDKVLETLDEIEAVSGRDEMTTLTRYDVLRRDGKDEEAYEVLEKYNSEYSSSRILAAMGDYNVARFRDTLALDNYTEALSYDSSNPQALLGVTEVYRFRGDYPNYFASVNTFINAESVPMDAKGRYLTSLLGHTDPQFKRNFKPNLDLLVDNFLAQAPSDTLAGATACSYFYSTGNAAKARNIITKAVEANPESVSARAIYVQLLSADEDWDGLLEAAEKAFADFPSEPGFLEIKTVAEYQKKDYDALIADCERMMKLPSADSASRLRSLSLIGDAYHLKGDSKKAYAAYDKALKIDPENCPVLNNYAYYLSLEGKKLKKAYSMSKITITKEPDNATYLDTFGWILYLQGKPLEAKPFFKHAMLYGGKDSATILDHYAEVLYALKEYDLARVYWNMAKSKNTDGSIPDLDERVKERLEAVAK